MEARSTGLAGWVADARGEGGDVSTVASEPAMGGLIVRRTDCPAEDLTHFAPAVRADEAEVQAARQRVLQNDVAMTILESMPDLVLILNPQRQVVAANRRVMESLGAEEREQVLGLRPGELVECVNVDDAPNGCGTGENCRLCGAVNAILECLQTGQPAIDECRIRTRLDMDGGALDLQVLATPLPMGDLCLVALMLRDISAEKRRSVLERVFFHDVLNIAAGIQAIAELLADSSEDPEAEEQYKRDLWLISQQLEEEITVQRQLLAAERGSLELGVASQTPLSIMESVAELYRHHTIARDRQIVIGDAPRGEIVTDPTLLRRVLGNLVKNALEASDPGGLVMMDAEERGDGVIFHVRNAAVMPEDIQRQIFQRSFSTKAGSGRGIGTHSVKLLTERYLQGQVSFTSRTPEGTVFSVALPHRLQPGQADG